MIYRVENEKGEGPYDGNWNGYARKNCCGRQHPAPGAEGWRGVESAEVFGFTSKEQLYRWFRPADLQALASDGYHLIEYDSTPHWQSETQCTFFK